MKTLVSVNESTSIEKCVEIILEKNIGSLGISSNIDGIAGIITKTDIARYYSKNYYGKHTVGDLMTIYYIAMNSDNSLKDSV
jgi:predicted transcriptional regulator